MALVKIITARKRSLGQGNIFIGLCQEFCSRGVSARGCLLPGGVSAPQGGVCFQGGCLIPRGVCLLLGGVCSRGAWSGGLAFCYGLLVWPSGLVALWLKVVFCYGLLVWPSGKAFWYWGVILTLGGVWWRPPLMDTAAGGTHPTGMHSCT